MDAEGRACVGAVHGARRRIDEVLHAAVPAGLQDVGEADQIRRHILFRVRQGVSHAGLGCEVNDAFGSVFGE